MNSRIQELSKEAGELAGLAYNPPVRSKSLTKIWEDGHIPWSDLYNALFTELIVRECLSKIENEAAQYAEPVWAFELVNDIKEHFGFGNRA